MQARNAEVTRFKIHRAGDNAFSFKCNVGEARRGHPTRPILGRKLAVEHCAFVRDAIKEDPTIDTIEYGDEIDGSTVSRFVACISPTFRLALPTYDVVEIFNAGHRDFRTTKIQWSIQELEDLYMFAHTMGALDVCDMIIDRIHGELNRPQQHIVRPANGMATEFNIVGISPAFLNFLSRHEKGGFDFFIDILAITAGDNLELLKMSRFGSWNQKVKRTLIKRLKYGETSEAIKNDVAAICSKYHFHQGSGQGCYKSKMPREPLVMTTGALQQLPSPPATPRKRVKPSKREESIQSSKKRKLQANMLAFQEIECKTREASGRVRFGSNNEQAKTRLQKTQQEIYDDGEEYAETSDSEHSSNDDRNATIIRLPEVYSKTRDLFRNNTRGYAEPYEYTQLPSEPRQGKRVTRNVDGLRYCGEGMNLVKDSAEMQRRKMAIVKEKLKMFRDCSHESYSGRARERSHTVPRMASEDMETTDEDEGDD
jgi:hypothetical protein